MHFRWLWSRDRTVSDCCWIIIQIYLINHPAQVWIWPCCCCCCWWVLLPLHLPTPHLFLSSTSTYFGKRRIYGIYEYIGIKYGRDMNMMQANLNICCTYLYLPSNNHRSYLVLKLQISRHEATATFTKEGNEDALYWSILYFGLLVLCFTTFI